MSTDTKRARDIADRLEDYDKYVDACDDAASMLRALADEVERLQDSRDADRTAQRYQTDGVSDMTSYEDYSAARSRWFHERDTIWKPLLEVAELADEELKHKRGGSCLVCDAIQAAREAMGEEK